MAKKPQVQSNALQQANKLHRMLQSAVKMQRPVTDMHVQAAYDLVQELVNKSSK